MQEACQFWIPLPEAACKTLPGVLDGVATFATYLIEPGLHTTFPHSVSLYEYNM